ncbi:MAG: quinolinate synthase NadA [Oscillospiraceae bacterium]|nr:quinolinate synthase NadA [Oscillospiraceae bacterium]MCR5805920.1 quinolinate synthase NadA [Oscillospiraceae bacterium]
MKISEIQEKILKLKKELDFCILVHAYQTHDIVEIADFVGDSFGLAQKAAACPNKNIMMCGVRFMAETVKILSPEKRVFLPEPDAGCPMAEQLGYEELKKLREECPDHTVVCYINTTAKLKTLCDVCVTSSSAIKVIEGIENDKILFIPDCNLGDYTAKRLPQKSFRFINGGCPIHLRITAEDVALAKEKHPNALVALHPECRPNVTALADYVGSTTGIMDFARKSDAKEFIIGTESAIVSHLAIECPEKRFYPLHKELICKNMKLTTISSVYNTLLSTGGLAAPYGEEILIDDDTRTKAKRCIDEMLRLGG